jgi:aspartyl-tRNA(Asn)/glutamyl-tRNA(Gln) amidotransferase subunit A
MAATGSDTGGSIRIPAAVCGVVGIKPTYGVVSRRGVAALAWSLDHVGPLARSVDDAAAVFEVLVDPAVRARLAAAPDPSDARSEGTVLGVPTDAVLSRVLPSVRAAFEEACAVLVDAGARLVEVSIPELEETLPLEFAIVAAEAASFHAEHLRTSAALIGPEIRALFQAGAILPSADYLLAQRLRSVLCSAVARTFDENGLDALCTPTLPLGPWRFEDTNLEIDGVEEAVIEAAVRTTAPFNLTGLPTVSVPMGLDERALPVGLQLVGRPYLDRTAIAVARAYEQRRGPLAAVTPLHRAPGVPQTV